MPTASQRARALALVKRKRKEKEVAAQKAAEEKEKLLSELSMRFKAPTDGKDGLSGKDGRDAPTIEEILSQVRRELPEPSVIEKTIVQQIDAGAVTDVVQLMLDAKIPEIEKSLRPKVELIREDVSEEKLKGFVSKKDFDKALKRIQDAISYHSGGGSTAPNVGPLVNLIPANGAENTVAIKDLDLTKINIVHATVAGSTVELPKSTDNYVLWVQDAVVGGGNITITREA